MKRLLAIAIVALMTAGAARGAAARAAGDADQPGEYQVKAAFLANFLQFLDWPPGSVGGETVLICVIGELPDPRAFEDLRGELVRDKRLQVRTAVSVDALRECNVVFIAPAEDRRLPRILDALRGAGVLTLGDTEGFAEQGVMINFSMRQRRVRFEINVRAIRSEGFSISAKVLRLATVVHGASREED